MSSVNDILTQLIDDLASKISTSSGYNTDPIVRHGRYTYDQMENDLPAICVSETSIDPQGLLGGMGYGWLNILIYGYAKHDGYGYNEAIVDLALDVIKFLFIDFTHTDDTDILSAVDIYPGGKEKPVSLFTIELRVKFDWTNSTINE